jgi:hypothetical protein
MNNNCDFQIVCVDCGCLAIRIEDPVKASRDAVVYCGDCGASRGTVGALRDLAVRPDPEVLFSARSISGKSGRTAIDWQSSREISKRYDELQRLRRRVEIAESQASSRQATGHCWPYSEGECDSRSIALTSRVGNPPSEVLRGLRTTVAPINSPSKPRLSRRMRSC